MNEDELQQLLKGRTGMEQRVYSALRERSPLTDRALREMLGSRGSGPRDALQKLLPTGVVRHAGKASTAGKPMQYEATPLAEVEAAAERFAVRKPRRRRSRRSAGARLAELRQMEDGDCRKWYPVRDQILATLGPLSQTLEMAFWKSVPPDELELALEEIEELHEAAGEALAAGRERLEHEKHKSKIAKLQATEGRTASEKDTAHRLAEKLSQKLIPGDSDS
ncbi:MAG TPA: hypothetical protein VFY75_06415 [Solirubrobacterales bacterium]|nr:hypothetical protein [Solirubrobacterales bacterium]